MALEKSGDTEFEAELEKLSQALSSGKEKKIDLVEFMQNCTELFDKIESSLRQGSGREKETVYRRLKELSSSVEGDIQDLCKESGKSEDEITAYLENPDNFTQEVWQAIQKTHRRILTGRQRKGKKKQLE